MTDQDSLQLEADPHVPLFRATRAFRFPKADVFRAHTDPALVAQWLGPRRLQTRIDSWDCRTGGSYRFTNFDDMGNEYGFFGSFHEVVPDTRIVQTFTFMGTPDDVALQRMELIDLDEGRSLLQVLFLAESFAARDGHLAAGMEHGAREGYERLEELLQLG
jgi:uncharacterized protein YndB with AHSA1/START domain